MLIEIPDESYKEHLSNLTIYKAGLIAMQQSNSSDAKKLAKVLDTIIHNFEMILINNIKGQ